MRLTVFIADGDRALWLTWRVMYYWPAGILEGKTHTLGIPTRITQLLASGKTRQHVRRRPMASERCRSRPHFSSGYYVSLQHHSRGGIVAS